MNLRKGSGVVLGSLASMLMALACNSDDTVLAARTQSRVNGVLNSESDIQVNVNRGVATLTGVASSDAMRARAIATARSSEGVRDVVDHLDATVADGWRRAEVGGLRDARKRNGGS